MNDPEINWEPITVEELRELGRRITARYVWAASEAELHGKMNANFPHEKWSMLRAPVWCGNQLVAMLVKPRDDEEDFQEDELEVAEQPAVSQDEETQRTRVYRITLIVVDHDECGPEGVASALENARYPNRCISPTVVKTESRVVDWHDGHPLNSFGCDANKLFEELPADEEEKG